MSGKVNPVAEDRQNMFFKKMKPLNVLMETLDVNVIWKEDILGMTMVSFIWLKDVPGVNSCHIAKPI